MTDEGTGTIRQPIAVKCLGGGKVVRRKCERGSGNENTQDSIDRPKTSVDDN